MNLTEEGYRILKIIYKTSCQKHDYHIRALRLDWWICHIAQSNAHLP